MTKNKPPTGHRVLLFHGLARLHLSMAPLARYLRNRGHSTRLVQYPSRKQDCRSLVLNQVRPLLESEMASTDQPLAFVTHSLGGLLVSLALEQLEMDRPVKLVMLAPPLKGSELADHFNSNVLFRWFFGPVLGDLTTDAMAERLNLSLGDNVQVGVIAGCTRAHPLFHDILPRPNDGTVPVERTKMDGIDHHLVINASHPFIMWRRAVMKQVGYFLETGTFETAD